LPTGADKNNKERFSNRVDAYVKYRPSYPDEAIAHLYHTIGFSVNSVIADVGAGTGKFTELLLWQGSRVIAVEPNKEMREARSRSLVLIRDFELCRALPRRQVCQIKRLILSYVRKHSIGLIARQPAKSLRAS
jgi:SAM-dependent methyltransferase